MAKKIIKMNDVKKETPKMELNYEELELKEKLAEIDKKVDSAQYIMNIINEENKNSMFTEDIVDNIVGIMAVTAATNIIGQYFGLEQTTLDDMLK